MSRGLGEKLGISMVEDMCSVPPATMVVALPTMIRSEAIAMVCSPEEQNLLTVCAGTVSGIPASSEDSLATLYPCVPSGIAHPMMTSSTSSLSSPSARPTASPIAAAAMSSGRLARKVPLGARPTAVLAPETITASRIVAPFSRSAFQLVSFRKFLLTDKSPVRRRADMLVPSRLSCFQQCFDAFVGFLLLQEVQECLFLQL